MASTVHGFFFPSRVCVRVLQHSHLIEFLFSFSFESNDAELVWFFFLVYPPHVCDFIICFRCGSCMPNFDNYFHKFTYIHSRLLKIALLTFNRFSPRYRCHSCEQPDCRESPEGVHMCQNAIQVSAVLRCSCRHSKNVYNQLIPSIHIRIVLEIKNTEC